MTSVAGKVAVVTGGASGIGLGIASALRAAGSEVVVADLSIDEARRAAQLVDGLAVHVDVADVDSVAQLAQAAVDHFGGVDILVNNAGIGPQAPLADMSVDDWRWLLDVNLWGVIHGVTAFLPLIQSRPAGGHIVNVASMSALAPMPPLGGYAVTKVGVTALTEVLARELEANASRVHATVVLPGPTRTHISASLRNRPSEQLGGLKEFENSPPPELWRTPEQVAAVVLEAIESNALYAVTHPELWPRVADRQRLIAAAFGQ